MEWFERPIDRKDDLFWDARITEDDLGDFLVAASDRFGVSFELDISEHFPTDWSVVSLLSVVSGAVAKRVYRRSYRPLTLEAIGHMLEHKI